MCLQSKPTLRENVLPERRLRLEHRPNAPSIPFFRGKVPPLDYEWECPLNSQWGLVILPRCFWSQLCVPEAPALQGAAQGLVLSLSNIGPRLWAGSQWMAPTLACACAGAHLWDMKARPEHRSRSWNSSCYCCTGLAKKFVLVFQHQLEKPKQIFDQSNNTVNRGELRKYFPDFTSQITYILIHENMTHLPPQKPCLFHYSVRTKFWGSWKVVSKPTRSISTSLLQFCTSAQCEQLQ